MSKVAYSIDWIRCTMTFVAGAPIEGYAIDGGELEERPSHGSYNNALGNDHCTIYWHSEKPENRVLIEMTGTDLSLYRKSGGSDEEIIALMVGKRAKFTRLDYAIDLMDTGGVVKDLSDAHDLGKVKMSAKTKLYIAGTESRKSTGDTVYLGSRHSERCVRVYDKAKERGLKIDWLRVELEWKGKRAMQLALDMTSHTPDGAAKVHLRDFVAETNQIWFEGIFREGYDQFDIDKISRPESDFERWLFKVVIPAVVKGLDLDVPGFEDAIFAALKNERRDKHGPSVSPGQISRFKGKEK